MGRAGGGFPIDMLDTGNSTTLAYGTPHRNRIATPTGLTEPSPRPRAPYTHLVKLLRFELREHGADHPQLLSHARGEAGPVEGGEEHRGGRRRLGEVRAELAQRLLRDALVRAQVELPAVPLKSGPVGRASASGHAGG